jgi:hypothetical protein
MAGNTRRYAKAIESRHTATGLDLIDGFKSEKS